MITFFKNRCFDWWTFLRRIPRPVWAGVLAAILLFLLFLPSKPFEQSFVATLGPMGASYAFDHFTLPRCGLALLNGTSILTSAQDYTFGYFATNWISHPVLCAIGIPLTWISPWSGFWLTELLYLSIHIFLIIAFGYQWKKSVLMPYSAWDYVFFIALGAFYPMFPIYVLGQYHMIAVFALGLALLSNKTLISSFVMSACSKPILAPLALCLIAKKYWKIIITIALWVVIFNAPSFLNISFSPSFSVSIKQSYLDLLNAQSVFSRFTVWSWHQEMGVSKVFDEFIGYNKHLELRYILGGIISILGALVAWKKDFRIGMCFSSLWFFFLYGRNHEYHFSSLIPVFLCLFAHESGLFRKPWFVILAVFSALPTTWLPMVLEFRAVKGLNVDGTLALFREVSPQWFWPFMLHRALGVFFLVIGILVVMLRYKPAKRTAKVYRKNKAFPTTAEQSVRIASK